MVNLKHKEMTDEVAFMKRILPDHYTCEPRENGVHCYSKIGIQDTFPSGTGGDDHWDIIEAAIKQKFGERFQEIYFQVNSRLSKFTVYIKELNTKNSTCSKGFRLGYTCPFNYSKCEGCQHYKSNKLRLLYPPIL